MRSSPFHLVCIVVQANHVASRKGRDLSSRFTNTTTNIKNCHGLVDVDSVGQIMLVASKSLKQRLANSESAEVK